MFIFGLHSISDDRPGDLSDKLLPLPGSAQCNGINLAIISKE